MTEDSKRPHASIRTESTQWGSSWPESAEDERFEILCYLEDRFGIPSGLFADYLFFKGRRAWFMMKVGKHLPEASRLRVSKVGLRAFHRVGKFVKPTTRLIQIFGRFATKATIEVTEQDVSRLLAGETISFDLEVDKGYVILTLPGQRTLGLGFYADGTIRSQLPQKEIRSTMLAEPKRIARG